MMNRIPFAWIASTETEAIITFPANGIALVFFFFILIFFFLGGGGGGEGRGVSIAWIVVWSLARSDEPNIHL